MWPRPGILCRSLAPALALGTLSLAACGKGAPAEGPLPAIASAQATRDVVDGAAQLTTTIDVTFDRDFTLAPRTLPLSSAFDVYLAQSGGGSPRRVLVGTATQLPDDPHVIRLTVKRPVPDGSEVRVARDTFHRKESGDIRGKIASDLSPALATLAAGPLLLTDETIAVAAREAAVTDAVRDPQKVRAELERHLDTRGSSADVRQRALARYDTIPADIVPSPRMRAALAALTGTFAEAAIDNLVTAANCTNKPAHLIAFQVPPDGPGLAARVTFTAEGARIVSLNPFLEGESIEHIMPFLVHEAVHCDRLAGRFEEIAATAFDTYFYLQLVAVDPDVARTGTRAAREQNIDAIAMINSGRRFPELVGILPAEGVDQVLPGSNAPYTSFAELVAAAYSYIDTDDSPAEPLAQQYVTVLARDAGLPIASAFNLTYLDELFARSLDLRLYADALDAFALAPAK